MGSIVAANLDCAFSQVLATQEEVLSAMVLQRKDMDSFSSCFVDSETGSPCVAIAVLELTL